MSEDEPLFGELEIEPLEFDLEAKDEHTEVAQEDATKVPQDKKQEFNEDDFSLEFEISDDEELTDTEIEQQEDSPQETDADLDFSFEQEEATHITKTSSEDIIGEEESSNDIDLSNLSFDSEVEEKAAELSKQLETIQKDIEPQEEEEEDKEEESLSAQSEEHTEDSSDDDPIEEEPPQENVQIEALVNVINALEDCEATPQETHNTPEPPPVVQEEIVAEQATKIKSPNLLLNHTNKSKLYALSGVLVLVCLIAMGSLLGGTDNEEKSTDLKVSEDAIRKILEGHRKAKKEKVKASKIKEEKEKPIRFFLINYSNEKLSLRGDLESQGGMIRRISLEYDNISGEIPSNEEFASKNFTPRINSLKLDHDLRSNQDPMPLVAVRTYYSLGTNNHKTVSEMHVSIDEKNNSLMLGDTRQTRSDRLSLELESGENKKINIMGNIEIKLTERNASQEKADEKVPGS